MTAVLSRDFENLNIFVFSQISVLLVFILMRNFIAHIFSWSLACASSIDCKQGMINQLV